MPPPIKTRMLSSKHCWRRASKDSWISHKLLAIVFSGNLVGFPVCGFWSGNSWFSWEFLTEAAAESLSWSFWPLAWQKYLCLSRRWGPNQKQGQKPKHLKKVEQLLLDTCMSGMWHFCIHPERRVAANNFVDADVAQDWIGRTIMREMLWHCSRISIKQLGGSQIGNPRESSKHCG